MPPRNSLLSATCKQPVCTRLRNAANLTNAKGGVFAAYRRIWRVRQRAPTLTNVQIGGLKSVQCRFKSDWGTSSSVLVGRRGADQRPAHRPIRDARRPHCVRLEFRPAAVRRGDHRPQRRLRFTRDSSTPLRRRGCGAGVGGGAPPISPATMSAAPPMSGHVPRHSLLTIRFPGRHANQSPLWEHRWL